LVRSKLTYVGSGVNAAIFLRRSVTEGGMVASKLSMVVAAEDPIPKLAAEVRPELVITGLDAGLNDHGGLAAHCGQY
jgi:hypothetical protein